MRCIYCGAEIPAGVRFCLNCGQPVASPLETEDPYYDDGAGDPGADPYYEDGAADDGYGTGSAVCGNCGSPVEYGDKFCCVCGTPIIWDDDPEKTELLSDPSAAHAESWDPYADDYDDEETARPLTPPEPPAPDDYPADPHTETPAGYEKDPYGGGSDSYGADPYGERPDSYGVDPYGEGPDSYGADPYGGRPDSYGADPYGERPDSYGADPYGGEPPYPDYPADDVPFPEPPADPAGFRTPGSMSSFEIDRMPPTPEPVALKGSLITGKRSPSSSGADIDDGKNFEKAGDLE